MFKNHLLSVVALAMLVGIAVAGEENSRKPAISTTIDFLDYVFDQSTEADEIYPLERYEKAIAELAAAGIRKIYLRVNVCGLTLYPTRVALRYGSDGNHHRGRLEPHARRLIRTLEAYNPLTETIRIGKKYGMEVWAWESVWDDAGIAMEAAAEPGGEYPLMDPFFRKNPEYYLWRKPDPTQNVDSRQAEAINRRYRNSTIGRVVITSADRRPAIGKFTWDDLVIYGSRDNREFFRYNGPGQLEQRIDAAGYPEMILSGLELEADFVAIAFKSPRPRDESYAYVLRAIRGRNRVFDTSGRELPTVWSWQTSPGKNPGAPVRINNVPAAWDYDDRALAFMVGEPVGDIGDGRYLLGVAELMNPRVMEHKLARFAEIAAYPFDGFMLNIRGHVMYNSSDDYGYNPEVRAAFLKRYGKDIWRDKFDRDAWLNLRAEAYDDFLAACKRRTGGRPLFVAVTDNGTPEDPAARYGMVFHIRKLGMPWHYDRWFAAGTVDGVMMHGDFFPEHFRGKKVNGKPVVVGFQREMIFYPAGSTLEGDIRRCREAGVDELELYETLVLNQNPELLETIRTSCNGKTR